MTWSAPVPFNGLSASQIFAAPAGTVVGAVGFGNASPVVVNLGTNLAPVVFGSFLDPTVASLSSASAVTRGSGAYPAATGSSSGDANFNAVLNGFATGSSALIIKLINLVGGATYSVQLFAVDDRAAGGNASINFQDPADGSNVSGTITGSSNSYIVGTFTVPAGANSVTLQENLPTGSGTLNALIVRAVSFTPTINFTLQPVDRALDLGDTATFSAMATGPAPLVPQWQFGPAGGPYNNLTDGGRISGSGTYNLTITNLNAADASGRYVLKLTSGSLTATSRAASLSAFGHAGTVVNVAPGGNINAAISSVSSAGGGTVQLAAGTYSGSVAMLPNVTLKGTGSNTILVGGTLTQAYQGASNWSVENLLIDVQVPPGVVAQAASQGPGNAGIFAGDSSYDTSNLSFKNVEIKNAGIAMQLIGVNGVSLLGCNFHDSGLGFSHNIYFVGCLNLSMTDCISSWSVANVSRTGDGVHLDFIGSTATYTLRQCDFSGNEGYGILCQDYNGDYPNLVMSSCLLQHNGLENQACDGMWILARGTIATTRSEYNDGYGLSTLFSSGGATTSGLVTVGNTAGATNSSGVSGAVDGLTANNYLAERADGVTGAHCTADWVRNLGGNAAGAVDFNTNHSSDGTLTWPNVSAPAAGAYGLQFVYANGSTSALAMPVTVNGNYAGTAIFAPTGSWSTYSTATLNVPLTAANNTVRLDVLSPSLGSPILSSLVVNASVPSVPGAVTGLAWAGNRNAPRTDITSWIDLSWSPVNGATYYNIYRNGLALAHGVAATSFTDKHVLGANTPATYTVAAVNAGGQGPGATVSAMTIPNYPATLSASAIGKAISLSCAASAGAQSYNIYRATVSGGPYTQIGTTAAPSYLDVNVTLGSAYYYDMTASNGINESLYSPEASAAPYLPYAGAPVLIDFDFGSGATQTGPAILGSAGDRWNAVTTSTTTIVNSSNSVLSGVGLSLSAFGTFVDTGGVAMDAGTSPLMQDYAFGYSSTPNVSVSVAGLAAYRGANLTLVVMAAGDSGSQGASLTLAGASGGNSTSSLSTSGGSRLLSAGPGVAYQTFTGTLSSSSLSIIAAPLSGQQFTAVNGFQMQLAGSASSPAAVTGLSASVASGGVSLTWSATAGASYYVVRRSAVSGGPYTTLGGASGASFVDYAPASGATYYYVVSAVNGAGESPASAEAIAATFVTITNFGFETPATSTYQYGPTGPGVGWTFSALASGNGSGVTANGSGFTSSSASAPQASQAAFLQGTGTISQTIAGLIPGATYAMTFAAAERNGNQQTWNVTADELIIASFNPGIAATSYADRSATFTAGGTSATLAFAGTNLAGGDNTVFIDNVRLVPATKTFAAYAQQYFSASQLANSAVSGPGADANGDGVSNLLAAALGLNPLLQAAGGLPIIASAADHLTLTYTRPKGSTEWTSVVEVSSDLASWQSGPTYTTQTAATSLSASLDQITVQDNTAMTGHSPRFMRLKVTLP